MRLASAAVVGLGGLGNAAATHLVAAGVGRVGIIDDDAVSLPNLQRQVLFREEDLGRPKVAVAANRLAAINSEVTVEQHQLKLNSENALGVLRDYDVVADCTDNLAGRYLVNDACKLLSRPDVFASASRFDGQASVFFPPTGPCYRCVRPVPPPPGSVLDCEEAGVLGVVPAVMGTIQAGEAVKVLLGRGSPLIGRLLSFSALDATFAEVKLKLDPDCPLCGRNPTVSGLVDYEAFCGLQPEVPDIEPKELARALAAGERVVLLDVREPFEYHICRLDGSTLIPLGQLAGRIDELNRNGNIVVYCHTGVRSRTAVRLLRDAGFTHASNLKGGIDAWSLQVDPATPRY